MGKLSLLNWKGLSSKEGRISVTQKISVTSADKWAAQHRVNAHLSTITWYKNFSVCSMTCSAGHAKMILTPAAFCAYHSAISNRTERWAYESTNQISISHPNRLVHHPRRVRDRTTIVAFFGVDRKSVRRLTLRAPGQNKQARLNCSISPAFHPGRPK